MTVITIAADDKLATELQAIAEDDSATGHVDFVDCAIAAMAERLGVSKVLTVDRRHFGLFRPRHCSTFDIAP